MLAVVKRPHTEQTLFEIKGDIPKEDLNYLQNKYGKALNITEDDDEEYEIATETDWFQEIQQQITPGDCIKVYRENSGWSQAELGKKIGNLSVQKISDMENGRRGISKAMAKKFSRLFDVPIERFLT